MNEENLAKKAIYDDYKKVLSTEAGKRVFGGIFEFAQINISGIKNEYQQGLRDLAVTIANTIRHIDPHLIAECEIAYANLLRSLKNERERNISD